MLDKDLHFGFDRFEVQEASRIKGIQARFESFPNSFLLVLGNGACAPPVLLKEFDGLGQSVPIGLGIAQGLNQDFEILAEFGFGVQVLGPDLVHFFKLSTATLKDPIRNIFEAIPQILGLVTGHRSNGFPLFVQNGELDAGL